MIYQGKIVMMLIRMLVGLYLSNYLEANKNGYLNFGPAIMEWDIMHHQGNQEQSNCPLCGATSENTSHLFQCKAPQARELF